jgi:hypothetical protein
MNDRFDDVCRILGSSMPRRRALRLLLGVLAGVVVGPLVPTHALAGAMCGGKKGGSGRTQGDGCGKSKGSCPDPAQCCTTGSSGTGRCCCAPDFVCCGGNTCCQTCCDKTKCCESPDKCIDKMCCPDEKVCENGKKCCDFKCNKKDQKCCPLPKKDPEAAYFLSFGGTFVADPGVVPPKSITECQECGSGNGQRSGTAPDPTSITAETFLGSLEGYDFASRSLIGPVTFDSLQGTVFDDGDVEVMAEGSGPVNGVPTNIALMADKTAGVITYSLFDSDTGIELAGGTGEPGRATLELTITFA